MKIIVIGASGLIGTAVCEALSGRHQVIRVSRKSGDFQADITSMESLEHMFAAAAPFDAVVSCAGTGAFKALPELNDTDFEFSLKSKLMGQVNVVRVGMKHIADGGSFTLTSGVLSVEPMLGSAAISLVNAGLEGFARAAALELAERRVRVNVVSPPWVSETLQAMGQDPSVGLPAARVALAYVEAVEDMNRSGEVIDARKFGR